MQRKINYLLNLRKDYALIPLITFNKINFKYRLLKLINNIYNKGLLLYKTSDQNFWNSYLKIHYNTNNLYLKIKYKLVIRIIY